VPTWPSLNGVKTVVRIAALGAAAALVLGACSNNSEPAADASPSPSASISTSTSPSPKASHSVSSAVTSAAAGELPTVDGNFGSSPKITVPDADPPTDLVVKTLSKGKGDPVAAGDTIVVNYLGVRWADGQAFDTSFGSSPAGFQIGVHQVIPGWDSGLVGVPVGSRIMLVVPPDQGYGDQPQGDVIQPGDTLVFVVDVLGAHSPEEAAKGEPAPTEDDSLPAVSLAPHEPDINLPAGNPPKKLVSIPVVVGAGPKVQKGDTLVVQYKGMIWRNGQVFDSSWSRKTPTVFAVGQGNVVAGLDKGLVGQTVGSRVLLVIPPDQGYGKAGHAPIKGTDTMVFAVDILGAY